MAAESGSRIWQQMQPEGSQKDTQDAAQNCFQLPRSASFCVRICFLGCPKLQVTAAFCSSFQQQIPAPVDACGRPSIAAAAAVPLLLLLVFCFLLQGSSTLPAAGWIELQMHADACGRLSLARALDVRRRLLVRGVCAHMHSAMPAAPHACARVFASTLVLAV